MKKDDLIQELIEKQMVIGMCYNGSEYDRGRVQGLQDAIDVIVVSKEL